MSARSLTRRKFLATTTAASAALAMPHVRGAHAAGKLSLGLWDHWVPGANTAMTELCEAWAAQEKVDLTIDYISTQGNKLLMTIAVEAQARSGHDIMDFSAWEPIQHANVSRAGRRRDDRDAVAQRAGQRCHRISREIRRPLDRGAGDPRDAAAEHLLAVRSDEAARRHRRPGDVSSRRRAHQGGGRLDLGQFPRGRREMPQGGLCVRPAARRHHRQHRLGRRAVPRLRRRAGGRQGQHHGADRRGAPGARLQQAARRLPAGGGQRLGQCVEQQVAGRRQGRADLQSAERLGGGQARRAAGRREAVDPRHAERPQGPLRGTAAAVPGPVELFQEQVRRQEPDAPRVDPPGRRKTGRRPARATTCRPSPSSIDFSTWDEESPPKGTLSHYPNKGDQVPIDPGGTGAAPDRRADLQPVRSCRR